MNKTCKILRVLLLLLVICLATSCNKDNDNIITKTSTQTNISKPEVSVSSSKANSTYDGWWVIGTVTTGGDDPSNVTCYLEWSKFSSKQSGSISFQNRDKMNVTNSSKTRVQFKKEHAGINSGNYIYYRLVGSNSKYSTTTSTTYMVATKY